MASNIPTIWVAFSGGLDSHVLLHKMFLSSTPVKAIHIHHGLSPNADFWASHCEKICAELNIDFVMQKINVPKEAGLSPEESARKMRYKAFAELLQDNDELLTAHHKDDQAETVLLQLFRGAGPKGLAAMPAIKSLGKGFHKRPLLDFTREELMTYAKEHQLKWIEDESNTELKFSRNFIRHRVMPLLQERWPTISHTLARVAENCADTESVLTPLLQAKEMRVSYLKTLTPEFARLLLREWLRQQNLPTPSSKKLNQIVFELIPAREDKMPLVKWGNVEVRRYQDELYVSTDSKPSAKIETVWDFQTPLNIGVGTLEARVGKGLKPSIKEVSVAFRKGGERCLLPGRSFHHSLKKLFQDWGVPPWKRDSVPLLYVGQELAAIVGFAVCEGFQTDLDEKGYSVTLREEG